jgi:hypothetical protein
MADVSITAAQVAPISGTANETRFSDGISGATVTAGQPIYKDASASNQFKLADGNASLAAATVEGIALHGATSGQPLRCANGGYYYPGFAVVPGGVYVLSTTAGGIAPVADLTSDNYTTVLLIGVTTATAKIVNATAGVHA